MDEYDDYPDEWFPEFPGDTRFAFCDDNEVHAEHTYRAINGNTYICNGFTEEDAAYLEELASAPPCEHGMSAHLCSGPMHY